VHTLAPEPRADLAHYRRLLEGVPAVRARAPARLSDRTGLVRRAAALVLLACAPLARRSSSDKLPRGAHAAALCMHGAWRRADAPR